MKTSLKMVGSGHAFIRMLACPDGTTARMIRVGSDYSQPKIVDHYTVGCADGLEGKFSFAEGQKELPAVPPGFRLKTDEEQNRFRIRGNYDRFSAGLDGALWIVTQAGYSYVATSITSDLKKGPLEDRSQFSNSFQKVSVFDRSRAIATGNMAGGYHLTSDGGQTWKRLKLPESGAVYTVQSLTSGVAWLAGSSGKIYTTSDYGLTWKKLNSPFNGNTRVMSLMMSDQKNGIAGSLDAGLLFATNDNWTTFHRILSPPRSGLRGRIDQVYASKTKLLVLQDGQVYMSKLSRPTWTKMVSPAIILFAFDPNSRELVGVDASGCVFDITPDLIASPKNLECTKQKPIAIEAVDGKAFVLTSENIFEVSQQSVVKSPKLPND